VQVATRIDRATGPLVGAVVATGLLVGASLDQSIKQLPARHRIGPAAFAAYSQAADLRNGVPFYATLGLGAAALTLVAAALGRRDPTRPPSARRALTLAAGLTLGHLLVTAVAAPVNFSQRTHPGDPAALARVFDLFERLTAVRTGLQAATLAAVAWALAVAITSVRPALGTPGSHRGRPHPTAGPTASRRSDATTDKEAGWAPSR
jgi:hypothetical protein